MPGSGRVQIPGNSKRWTIRAEDDNLHSAELLLATEVIRFTGRTELARFGEQEVKPIAQQRMNYDLLTHIFPPFCPSQLSASVITTAGGPFRIRTSTDFRGTHFGQAVGTLNVRTTCRSRPTWRIG